MSKLKIRKDDTVYVLAGKDKGKTGKVLKVLVEEQRAIVEGVNMVSKSAKPSAKKSPAKSFANFSTPKATLSLSTNPNALAPPSIPSLTSAICFS